MTPTLLAVSSPSISKEEKNVERGCGWGMGVGLIFLCLLVVFGIVLFFFWWFEPSFVVNPTTDEVDWAKLTLSSFIVALIGTILVWAIVSCR